MNYSLKLNRAAATVLALATLHLAAPAQGGLLDLLRGPKAVEAEYQKVAFVGSATVREVAGAAERLAGIDRWVALRPGARLEPGDIVRTGEGAIVLRMTASGSFVKVTPHTVLRLTELNPQWERSSLTGREEKSGFVIRACRGSAEFQDESGQWRALAVNSVLPDGTLMRMSGGTTVDLFWTREARSLRLNGQRETFLTASLFPGRPAETAVALAP